MTKTTEDRAAKIYSNAFWNAIGHGMTEDQSDAYATKKMYADRATKIAYRA